MPVPAFQPKHGGTVVAARIVGRQFVAFWRLAAVASQDRGDHTVSGFLSTTVISPILDAVVERIAVNILRHQVWTAFGHPMVEIPDDVGVVQSQEYLDFTLETS